MNSNNLNPIENKSTATIDLKHLKFLEDINGEKALQFAKSNNKISNERLKSDPRYNKTYNDIFKILSAKDKLPSFYIMNNEIYNFWQDGVHVKGILRKTSINSLNSGKPKWQTLLDLDQLTKVENINWVYRGMHCLEPQYEHCLISLSNGGKDALTLREFNLKTNSFVANGFVIPESKSHATWLDSNTLLVGDGTNPKTLTASGYPSQIKILKRGEALEKAQVLYSCDLNSMSVYVSSSLIGTERFTLVSNQLSFYEAEFFIVDFTENKLNKLPIPRSANFELIHKNQIFFSTREEYKNFPAGSLLSMPLNEVTSWKQSLSVVFSPDQHRFFQGLGLSTGHLYLHVLDDVKNKILAATFENNSWKLNEISIGDTNGNLSLASTDRQSQHVYFHYYDFLTPTSIFYLNESKSGVFTKIMQAPKRFDEKNLVIEQFKIASKDGTQIPYFIIHKNNYKQDGKNPTLLYAYGGFEIPLTASYIATTGKAWLEKGGIYVLANLRGGGEFGPHWHNSVIKENRHKVYEDFFAVSEDLIHRKITSPNFLGIKGGSNGGLLTAVAFTQRPELYKAVISEVPLANMLEYHNWLAGSSWMDEYGDPGDPEMRKYLLSYSPLHNINKNIKYPEVFFLTSTKDDRVHPAHARQMVARMKELGHEVLYNENTEGGHGRATDMKEMAEFLALEFTYLYQKLMN